MLVRFDLKDEQQKKILTDCLNVMNITWEEENSAVLNLFADNDPLVIVAMKYIQMMVMGLANDKKLDHAVTKLSQDQLTVLIKEATKLVDYNSLIDIKVLDEAIRESLKNLGGISI